jgi:hypothetical protein
MAIQANVHPSSNFKERQRLVDSATEFITGNLASICEERAICIPLTSLLIPQDITEGDVQTTMLERGDSQIKSLCWKPSVSGPVRRVLERRADLSGSIKSRSEMLMFVCFVGVADFRMQLDRSPESWVDSVTGIFAFFTMMSLAGGGFELVTLLFPHNLRIWLVGLLSD